MNLDIILRKTEEGYVAEWEDPKSFKEFERLSLKKGFFRAWAMAGFDFGVEFIFQMYLAPEHDFSHYLPLPKEGQ